MIRKALTNPMVVPTLGVLLEQPSHVYGIAKKLSEQGIPVNRGSLYDTLDATTQVGWTSANVPEQPGNRPVRITYTLTESGRQELVSRLDIQVRTPRHEFPEFMGAVAHIGVLGTRGALEALSERNSRLNSIIAESKEKLARTRAKGVPRLFVIEAEYSLALLIAEQSWVTHIITDITNGHISWPDATKYYKEVTNEKRN